MTGSSAQPMTIDVVSDMVCPWCYIGKRRLEAALDRLAAGTRTTLAPVRWHPFELNPDLPAEGIPRRAYVLAKFGGPGRATQVQERICAAGASAGIAFEFERIARQPNTRDAHRLVEWAQARGDAGALVERMFAAFFVEGRDIGDRDVLAAIAAEAGFDATAARAMLDSAEGRDEVEQAMQRAHTLGIGGVPFFIFGGRLAVSGAQEPPILADAIAEAAKGPRP